MAEGYRWAVPSDELVELRQLSLSLEPVITRAQSEYPELSTADAVQRLTKDFERKLEDSDAVVRSFRARIALRIAGNWTDGQPLNKKMTVVSDGDELTLGVLRDGEVREITLAAVGWVAHRPLYQDTVLTYEAEPKAGSWIMGSDIRSIAKYTQIRPKLIGFQAKSTTDGRIRLDAIDLKLFVNGASHLDFEAPLTISPIALPDNETVSITLNAREPIKPLPLVPAPRAVDASSD